MLEETKKKLLVRWKTTTRPATGQRRRTMTRYCSHDVLCCLLSLSSRLVYIQFNYLLMAQSSCPREWYRVQLVSGEAKQC